MNENFRVIYLLLLLFFLSGTPLIGCFSHRLNLDVNEFMGKEEKRNGRGTVARPANGYYQLIRKVDLLMGELKTYKNASKLRSRTHVRPTRINVTRWSSIFQMLIRWSKLREPISQVDNWPQTVLEKIPTPSENQTILILINDLKKFDSVSKKLQIGGNERLDLLEARSLFEGLLRDFQSKYPLTHMRADSNIITNPNFEKGIIKILDNRVKDLKPNEASACSIFKRKINEINEPDCPDNDLGYADQILRASAQKKRAREEDTEYRSVKHVSPISNICERLFSRANITISATRKNMDPDSLNMLLFLKANRKLWPNPSIIQKILNDREAAGLVDDDCGDESEDETEDDSGEEF